MFVGGASYAESCETGLHMHCTRLHGVPKKYRVHTARSEHAERVEHMYVLYMHFMYRAPISSRAICSAHSRVYTSTLLYRYFWSSGHSTGHTRARTRAPQVPQPGASILVCIQSTIYIPWVH